VYITHGHPDHWFGTASLLERFGDADSVVYATEGTIRQMRVQLEGKAGGFARSFPEAPAYTPVLAVPPPADGFWLDGQVLRAVETRHYLRDAIRLLADRPAPLEFFNEMMKLHGDRLNPGPLWYSGLGLLA
jgi:ribonuclease BN (tRNA processing enzyme)